jgi:uncharacterized protein (TIGR00251 family)
MTMSRIIKVDVKPKSKFESVEEIGDNHLLVHLKAEPKKGKANSALIKLLKNFYDMDVIIIKGHSSRRKIIEVIKR